MRGDFGRGRRDSLEFADTGEFRVSIGLDVEGEELGMQQRNYADLNERKRSAENEGIYLVREGRRTRINSTAAADF